MDFLCKQSVLEEAQGFPPRLTITPQSSCQRWARLQVGLPVLHIRSQDFRSGVVLVLGEVTKGDGAAEEMPAVATPSALLAGQAAQVRHSSLLQRCFPRAKI
mmetsp:Transcript_7072/g.10141  ORF Transcript_7072/g.10141 Transcript_7072/m.10141 type:complete len:102 (+) Transcript_7072:238-543(+)